MAYGPQTSSFNYMLNPMGFPGTGTSSSGWNPMSFVPQMQAQPSAAAATPATDPWAALTANPAGTITDWFKNNPATVMSLASGLLAGPTLGQGMAKGFGGMIEGSQLDTKNAELAKERARALQLKDAFAKWLKGKVTPEEAAVLASLSPAQQSEFFGSIVTPKKPDFMSVKLEGEYGGEALFDKNSQRWVFPPGSDGAGGTTSPRYVFGSSAEGRAMSVMADQSPGNVDSPQYAIAWAKVYDQPFTTYTDGPNGVPIAHTERLTPPSSVAPPGHGKDIAATASPTGAAPVAPPAPPAPSAGIAPPTLPFIPPNPAAASPTGAASPPVAPPPVSAPPVGPPNQTTQVLPSGSQVTTSATNTSRGNITAPTAQSPSVQVGEPPPNHAWARDANGFVATEIDPISKRSRPVPVPLGSQAEAGVAKQKSANAAAALLIDEADRAISIIDENPGIATGFRSIILRGFLGAASNAPAFRLFQKVAPIKANLAFAKLTDLRNQSTTGGAIGQVSNFEEQMLADSYGSMETSQNDDDLKYNLRRMQRMFSLVTAEGGAPSDLALTQQITDIGNAVDHRQMSREEGRARINEIIDRDVQKPVVFKTPSGAVLRKY